MAGQGHVGAAAMILRNIKGQNLIEYAIVVALVSAAMAAMSTYVFRSVQATQKAVTQEFANE
jgi:Flp pilus assembly pilin Flp